MYYRAQRLQFKKNFLACYVINILKGITWYAKRQYFEGNFEVITTVIIVD